MKRHSSLRDARAAILPVLLAILACETRNETSEASTGASTSTPSTADSDSQTRLVEARRCGTAVMTGRGIGDLRIGTTLESVRSLCPVVRDTTRLASEGQLARMISVALGRDTVEAEVVDGKVWRIEVLSPRLRTGDSIGVGTQLSRLLRLRTPRGITGEGQLFVVSPNHCGLSFRLSDNGSSARSQNWDRAALSRLPPRTVVDKVLIVGCEST